MSCHSPTISYPSLYLPDVPGALQDGFMCLFLPVEYLYFFQILSPCGWLLHSLWSLPQYAFLTGAFPYLFTFFAINQNTLVCITIIKYYLVSL